MTIIFLLLLLGSGAGLAYWMRTAGRGNPMALTARLGRYGLVTASADVSQIVTQYGRQQSESSAVSRSVERFVGKRSFGKKLVGRLESADLKWTPGEFVVICLAVFCIASAAGILVRGVIGLLALGIIGLVAPQFWLGRRSKKRKGRFLDQLADMAQMMGNSMRAGFSIIQSMEMVAQEGPTPASQEFERVTTEVKLGLPLDQALDHLLNRMPSEDLELAVVAINVQRQVGGNLAEILMVIAKTVRERVRFKRDLKALTSQARYSSYIITGLPVAVAFVINLIDRPYEQFLYTQPLGHIELGLAVVMLSLGFFFLNRIANIEV